MIKHPIIMMLAWLALSLVLKCQRASAESGLWWRNTIIEGKQGHVLDLPIALSPDGKKLAVQDQDSNRRGVVCIYDTERKQCIRTFPTQSYNAVRNPISFSLDGSLLLVNAEERVAKSTFTRIQYVLQVWDFNKGKVHSLKDVIGPFALLPNNKFRGRYGNEFQSELEIVTYNLTSGQRLQHLTLEPPRNCGWLKIETDDELFPMVEWMFSHDGSRGAVAVFKKTTKNPEYDGDDPSRAYCTERAGVLIFDAATGRHLRFINKPKELEFLFYPKVLSPDGRILELVTDNGIEFRDTITGRLVLQQIASEVNSQSVVLQFSPDGRQLAIIPNKSQKNVDFIRIYDTKTGHLLHILRSVRYLNLYSSLTFSSNSRFLAVGTEDGTVQIWRVR